jgi:hypothetical protein
MIVFDKAHDKGKMGDLAVFWLKEGKMRGDGIETCQRKRKVRGVVMRVHTPVSL